MMFFNMLATISCVCGVLIAEVSKPWGFIVLGLSSFCFSLSALQYEYLKERIKKLEKERTKVIEKSK